MEPQTKKQEHKGPKEKRNGFKGLHSEQGKEVICNRTRNKTTS
jgi:hypothetical protein